MTRRFWGGVATGGVLLAAAPLLGRPLLLGGGVAVLAWLLLQGRRFVGAVRRVRETAVVDQRVDALRATVDARVPVSVSVSLPTPAEVSLSVAVDPPLTATAATAAPVATLRAGDRDAAGETALRWDVAGRYRLPPPTTTVTDPAGLFVARVAVGDGCEVTVDPPGLARVDIGRTGRELVDSAERPVPRRAESGIDPDTVRRFVVGDSPRHVDWRATARLGTLHVREFESEQGRSTGLIVDARRSMAAGPPGRTKLDYARHLALSVHGVARADRVPVGLFVCDESGPVVGLPARADGGHADAIRRHLHGLRPPATGDGPEPGRHGLGHLRARRTPADAARAARALTDGSAFAERLRPYFARGDRAARRAPGDGDGDGDPLVRAVEAFRADRDGTAVTCLFTDDADRATLPGAVRAATRDGGEAVVFLAPSVLFDAEALADGRVAHDRFVEFERFRRGLAAAPRVTVYEVGPGDELAALLSRGAGGGRGRDRRGPGGGRRRGAGGSPPESARGRARAGTAAPTEGSE